jgi:hypothetical protein
MRSLLMVVGLATALGICAGAFADEPKVRGGEGGGVGAKIEGGGHAEGAGAAVREGGPNINAGPAHIEAGNRGANVDAGPAHVNAGPGGANVDVGGPGGGVNVDAGRRGAEINIDRRGANVDANRNRDNDRRRDADRDRNRTSSNRSRIGDRDWDRWGIGALDADRYRNYSGNDWRYRRSNNEWFYWMPAGYWMFYRDGRWDRYNADTYTVYDNSSNVQQANFNGPYYEDQNGFYYVQGGRRIYDPQIQRVASAGGPVQR